MDNICVIGTGYVGLVTGACFAELGNTVCCIDTDESKVESLQRGVVPIFEPGLDKIVLDNMEAGRLSFTTSFREGLANARFVFVTVGTPNTPAGGLDLSYMRSAYEMIGANLNGNRPIIINKSTIPPGTSEIMESMISGITNGFGAPSIVANPEFLREGHAISDFMNPARIVIGSKDRKAAEAVASLHDTFDSPIIFTDLRAAEMIKYASNAFLAMKISFINEIATICDQVGVDVTNVAEAMGMDSRIGSAFLNAGLGYGGSCLPKDVAVLTNFARENGYEPSILNAITHVNEEQADRLVSKVEREIQELQGAKVGVLGLTFKPDTDDLRYSSALKIITILQEGGADVKACDPQACLKSNSLPPGVEYFLDPYQMAEGCDAIILATEWPEYANIDLARLKAVMKGNILADGRNVISQDAASEAGFVYIGMGTGTSARMQICEAVSDPVLSD